MSFLKRLFGLDDPAAPEASRMFTQFAPELSQPAKAAAVEQGATRRELMRTVLRRTLARHGIPGEWIGAELLVATSRGREAGMHWRLLIKHWDARLLPHLVALQNSLIVRLLGYDPLAADWLMGVSWQFALPDDAGCPAMPQAGYWTAEPRPASPPPAPAVAPQPAGDVIAGPVRIAVRPPGADSRVARDSVRADLDKLMAVRDAELKRHAGHYGAPEATQPMYLVTEPQPLQAKARVP